jgi:phenylacetic acid degradation operon negative regulatory protein
VTAGRRAAAARAELRAALVHGRLAELREGVWMRPNNLELSLAAVVDEQCTTMLATGLDSTLVDGLWDLGGWHDRARSLRADMSQLVGSLERGDTRRLADGFVVSAAVLRHFQSDPLLPDELLPSRWLGDALRADYDRFDAAYRTVLREWFMAHAGGPQ